MRLNAITLSFILLLIGAITRTCYSRFLFLLLLCVLRVLLHSYCYCDNQFFISILSQELYNLLPTGCRPMAKFFRPAKYQLDVHLWNCHNDYLSHKNHLCAIVSCYIRSLQAYQASIVLFTFLQLIAHGSVYGS